ncbi:hypothetical protein RYX36_013148 [Vicia faba]
MLQQGSLLSLLPASHKLLVRPQVQVPSFGMMRVLHHLLFVHRQHQCQGTFMKGLGNSSNNTRPNYMNLAQSTKEKLKSSNNPMYNRAQRQQSMDGFQFMKRGAVFSNEDSRSIAASDHSLNFSSPLHLPSTHMDKSSVRPQ